jgi:pantoate--beta-alanine ligase
VQAAWSRGTRDPIRLRARVQDVVEKEPLVAPEYISVADPLTLAELRLPANRAVIALAARVGQTRLIDNVLLGMDVSELS